MKIKIKLWISHMLSYLHCFCFLCFQHYLCWNLHYCLTHLEPDWMCHLHHHLCLSRHYHMTHLERDWIHHHHHFESWLLCDNQYKTMNITLKWLLTVFILLESLEPVFLVKDELLSFSLDLFCFWYFEYCFWKILFLAWVLKGSE